MPSGSDLLWHADADADIDNNTDFNGEDTLYWGKEVTSGDWSRLSIVNDPIGVYGDVYSAYLTQADLAAGDNRAEFAQAYLGDGNTKLKLGIPDSAAGSTEDIYMGWRSLFGSDVLIDPDTANNGNWLQLKGDSSCGGPAIGLTIKYGHLTLRSEQYLIEYDKIAWNGPLMADVADADWHDFVLHVRFSKDASVGYLEVWFDGVAQTMSNGQTRIYFPTMCPNDTYVYPKMGTYSMDGGNPQHLIESPRIGLTYASAVPR